MSPLFNSVAQWLVLISAWLSISSAHADQPLLFFPNSLSQIENEHAGEPFLLSVWSISCGPCMEELQTLSKLKKEFPDFNWVLLSSDGPDAIAETQAFLSEFSLAGVSSWIYGTDQSDQLRYAIDPSWYGEMPRTYFYDKQGKRQSVSGRLSEARLRDWITSVMP